jgi:hypothetical protein
MSKKMWSISDLLQLSGGYWSSCALHAGVKLDIFTQLSECALSAVELAEKLGTDLRGLLMLLNALTALELIKKNGDRYAASAFAAELLNRNSEKYVGQIILHHHNLMTSWSRLDEAVRAGAPDGERISRSNDAEVRENFEMGMFNLAMQIAPQVVPFIDLTGRRTLLDLGGGPGTYAIHFCLHNPDLDAVVYDLPTTRPFAEKTISRFALGDRISFYAGDFMVEEIQGRFDVAWLSHILHGAGEEGSAVILGKAMSTLVSGGIIMIQEFILDDAMCSPLYPALFSLNMLLGTPDGRSFSLSEISSMLSAAGARDVKRLPIELPNGAGVISGTKP